MPSHVSDKDLFALRLGLGHTLKELHKLRVTGAPPGQPVVQRAWADARQPRSGVARQPLLDRIDDALLDEVVQLERSSQAQDAPSDSEGSESVPIP